MDNSNVPSVDSVHEGRIVRIETYGAFCQFQKWRGLIHISELASMRVENVADVVELDDHVWVRVLEVSPPPQDSNSRFPKIRLSLKNVPQDGTAPQQMAEAQQAKQAQNALEQNLHSTMGMAIARDPMAPTLDSNLILKEPKVIKGYALLLDDDDNDHIGNDAPSTPAAPAQMAPRQPMGRGRGLTMPAWMTTVGTSGGPTGLDEEQNDKRKDRKEKKKKKKHSKRDRRDHHDDSDDDDKRRHRRHRSRKRYYSSEDDEDRGQRRSKRKHHYSSDESRGDDSRHRRHRHRRQRSSAGGDNEEDTDLQHPRHRSESDRDHHGRNRSRKQSDHEFTSVEEAKRLVQEIEERRRSERR